MASPKVQRHLDGRPPRKVIVVPGRLVNLVG
jgi:leucyl-tRNA synthetase